MEILKNCRIVIMVVAIFLLAQSTKYTFAVTTKTWTNNEKNGVLNGTFHNITIHSNGKFTLSPEKRRLHEVPATYVWCLVSDGTEALFAGTGNPGSVYKISHNENIVEYFSTPESHVQTLVIDATGNIFAGTIPHGRIYKITSEGKGEVFCEIPDPYIWDMISDNKGNLYAATGNNGIIYKISDKGAPSVFFDSPFSNILDLVIDDDGNIYAASEPEGVIYKISESGKASVVFHADEGEIHCLAIDKEGILYAGTSSGVPPILQTPPPPVPQEPILPLIVEEFPGKSSDVWLNYVLSDADLDFTNNSDMQDAYADHEHKDRPAIPQKNSLYSINKEGRVREIFTVQDAFILSLAVDGHNNIIVGTGNNAKLFNICKDESSLLYDLNESQILDIVAYGNGSKFMATGNSAVIYEIAGSFSTEGVYESLVHDTKYISSWGCISWDGKTPAHTGISLFTRSGNTRKPDITWSNWSEVYQTNGDKIKSPSARFIQYRAVLTTVNPGITPSLDSVTIAYLPQNQPPIIKSVTVTTPRNYSESELQNDNDYELPRASSPATDTVNEDNNYNRKYNAVEHGPRKLISWEANDPNNDRLEYDLEYKSVDESKWKELRRKIKEKTEFSWNTKRIPDGNYQTKVIACDEPDNPRELALKEEMVSDTFLVDNTRPIVLKLETFIDADSTDINGRQGHSIMVSGLAKDELCNITGIQYSIDSGDWQTIFPEDKIFDSKEELFLFKIPFISSDEHTIVINAIDVEGNIGSNRIVFYP